MVSTARGQRSGTGRMLILSQDHLTHDDATAILTSDPHKHHHPTVSHFHSDQKIKVHHASDPLSCDCDVTMPLFWRRV